MDVQFGEFVTLVGLLFASAVALFRAVEEFVKTKALRMYAVLAGTAVALLAVYADKLVIK